MHEPDGFDKLSPREQADIERRRNQEQRLWFLEFKAKWLIENGIIEVRGAPASPSGASQDGRGVAGTARNPDD